MFNKIYKSKFISFMVLILLTTLFISGCFEPENNNKTRITAEKAYIESENISKTHYNKAILESITCAGRNQDGGKSTSWRFNYLGFLDNGTYSAFDITVNEKLESEFDIEGYVNQSERIPKPLLNWTLDSNDAYDIAKEEDSIKEYLNKYDDAKVDSMNLNMWDEYSEDDAVWVIKWIYGSGFGFANAHIVINAHTGEVLEVEADN